MTSKLKAMRIAEEQSAGRAIADYPVRLYAHHMAEVFGVSIKEFYRLESKGEFVFAEHRPRIGRKTWSRDRVAAYHDGTLNGLTKSRTNLRIVGSSK